MINRSVLSVFSLLLITGGSVSLPLQAQTPPASTYQPGPWQPVARLNPQSPFTVKIVNEARVPLQYDYSEEKLDPQDLPVGASADYVHTDQPLPVYVTINSTTEVGVKYTVTVTDNVATVKIREVSATELPDSTLTINPTGAIYLY